MIREQTDTEPNPYEIVDVCPLKSAKISDEASKILDQYSDIAHEQKTKDQAERRVEILRNFAGHDVPEWILDVAALAELAERAADKTSIHRNSRKYIYRYILQREDDPAESEVVKALAALSYVERELGADSQSRRRLGGAGLIPSKERLERNTLRAARRKKPTQRVETPWAEELDDIQLADPEKVLDLTDQMLFVPLLVKAAQTLDMLKNRREITKTEARRYLKDALEVYIPFCETLGYDGFALALSNAAHSLKTENQKNYHEDTAEVIKQKYENLFGKDNHLQAITQILDNNSEAYFDTIGADAESYGVKMGSFTGNLGGVEVDGRYRVKGLYTLLSKFFAKSHPDDENIESRLPMDMLGLTLITKTPEESAVLLGKLLERVTQDDLFVRVPTVERREKELGCIHVQGTNDFMRVICEKNGLDRASISSVEVSSDDFEVAKMTFMIRKGEEEIPTEVQIITRSSRDNGRRGLVGHMLHKLFGKLEKNDEETRQRREKISVILQTIHNQKKQMKDPIPITSKTGWFIHSFINDCRRAGV